MEIRETQDYQEQKEQRVTLVKWDLQVRQDCLDIRVFLDLQVHPENMGLEDCRVSRV